MNSQKLKGLVEDSTEDTSLTNRLDNAKNLSMVVAEVTTITLLRLKPVSRGVLHLVKREVSGVTPD